MNISEIYSAMGMKIKLSYDDMTAGFKEGALIRIEPSQDNQYFFVNQYGEGIENDNTVLCKASPDSSAYLLDLLDGENFHAYRCMFLVDGVEERFIEVQPYTFRTVTEYKTPINIIVKDNLLEQYSTEKLRQDYVWNKLGKPALFCLNYKNRKKQNAKVRFIGGKKYIVAQNTAQGIIAESVAYLKDKFDIPVDVYIAPEVNFVSESDAIQINDKLAEDLEKISNPASYFARWVAYDELSKKLLEAESNEFGELHYNSFSFHSEVSGVLYEFEVQDEDELDDSLIGKELGVPEKDNADDIKNIMNGKSDNNDKTYKKKRQIGVGSIKKISGNKITTFLEAGDNTELIPQQGTLALFTVGDRSILARRLEARNRMLQCKSPIKYIVSLIETGTSNIDLTNNWKSQKAITEEFRRNFRRANDLNPEQIAALDLAINTPDIALIQGPPGTGKTTVIKAIVERYKEIFEANEKQHQKIEKDYLLKNPKILISSFQNEAVDNAISTPLPGDIPAFRKTATRTKDSSKEQYQKSLDKWLTELKDALGGMIGNAVAPEFVKNKKRLDDAFLSYKNAGEPIDKAISLINEYLSYVEIPYPKEIVDVAKAIVSTSAVSDEDENKLIVKKLGEQRLTVEAFEDDGPRNARRLAAYIRINDDLEISEEIRKAIDAVCDDDYSVEDFNAYVNSIKILRKQFCKDRLSIDKKDKRIVNECILNLANVFSNHYLNTLSSLESKKSLILSDFLSRIQQDYEIIVKKYSMTIAATCQTSLDLKSSDVKYDLVIIDEAARANPLDLFIPMSMGKKIVLVGDHKQLPHMLEPDVLKVLKDDPRFANIPEIEKSLFERLFEMFSTGLKPKALRLTRQFRMHPDICRFVSEVFYDGLLETAKSVTPEDRLSPIEINNGKPLAFINIPLSKGAETFGASKSRWAEVEAIVKDVRQILSIDSKATIGIITFYSAQVHLLMGHLDKFLNEEEKNNIEIGTVDAFQGKEFDYVLLSCVRSNPPRDGKAPVVGFLEKPNRLCVAFSRAIRQLAVYGDVATLTQIPCFKRLYELCAIEQGGCYREY